MGIGVSLFLGAIGAVLIWGVNREASGVDLDVIGAILLVVAAIGIFLSLIFWSSWGAHAGRRRETVVREEPPPY